MERLKKYRIDAGLPRQETIFCTWLKTQLAQVAGTVMGKKQQFCTNVTLVNGELSFLVRHLLLVDESHLQFGLFC